MERKEVEMKRKILAVLLVMAIVLSTSLVQAFALQPNSDGIAPYYAGVSYVLSTMSIDDQILTYTVDVMPFEESSLDRVHIEAELRTLGGRVDKKYDEDLGRFGDLYTFSKRRAVSVEGTYFLEYTLTCYKNGKLIDKISKTTRTATYTR